VLSRRSVTAGGGSNKASHLGSSFDLPSGQRGVKSSDRRGASLLISGRYGQFAKIVRSIIEITFMPQNGCQPREGGALQRPDKTPDTSSHKYRQRFGSQFSDDLTSNAGANVLR
jgi:hypothetical protein